MKQRASAIALCAALLAGMGAAHAALPEEATLYKHPACSCCDEYAKHLEAMGVSVEIVEHETLAEIKQQAGVPHGLGSCHTIKMGDHWVEGHVPMEALEAFFKDTPRADGIGLAGMPIGTPGMPGEKQGPFEVYLFDDQQSTPYMEL